MNQFEVEVPSDQKELVGWELREVPGPQVHSWELREATNGLAPNLEETRGASWIQASPVGAAGRTAGWLEAAVSGFTVRVPCTRAQWTVDVILHSSEP